MKYLARIVAIPMGAIVGVLVWMLIYLSIFDSITLLPLSTLALTLSPGIVVGVVLAYFYPSVFLWFWSWEIESDTHVSDAKLETGDSNQDCNKSVHSKDGVVKKD